MQDSIRPKRPTSSSRARLLALATLVSGVLVSGCGGSSGGPNAATVGGGTTSASRVAITGPATTSASSAPGAGVSGPLAFARCMRANGVPKFPDPAPGRGALFQVGAGTDPSSPAFRAAQAKCQKFMGGGPPVPGTTTHPSAQTLAKLLKIAQCMRQHDVPQFPDPQTHVPSNPAGIREITDFDGAILLFPATIDMQAPAYRQALTACGAPPLGLPH